MMLVYSENPRNRGVQEVELLIVKVGGTYSYHWALKC
jgi:hypothetical protein